MLRVLCVSLKEKLKMRMKKAEKLKREKRKRRVSWVVASKNSSEYVLRTGKGFWFTMPRKFSRKMVCKATGFTREDDAVLAVSDTVGSFYSKLDNSSIYTCRFEKESEDRNTLYNTKMEVHLTNTTGKIRTGKGKGKRKVGKIFTFKFFRDKARKKVKYISFKRETVVISGRPDSMNNLTFRQREASAW